MFAVLLNFFPSFSEYIRQIVHEPKKEEMKLYKKYNIDLPENKIFSIPAYDYMRKGIDHAMSEDSKD